MEGVACVHLCHLPLAPASVREWVEALAAWLLCAMTGEFLAHLRL